MLLFYHVHKCRCTVDLMTGWHLQQKSLFCKVDFLDIAGTATFSRFRDLKEDAVYYFKIQAATKAGEGPATRTLEVHTHHIKTMTPLDNSTSKPSGKNDQQMGIIVGVSIGGACIAICILIFLLRNR